MTFRARFRRFLRTFGLVWLREVEPARFELAELRDFVSLHSGHLSNHYKATGKVLARIDSIAGHLDALVRD